MILHIWHVTATPTSHWLRGTVLLEYFVREKPLRMSQISRKFDPLRFNYSRLSLIQVSELRTPQYTGRFVWHRLLASILQNSPWDVATSLFRILVSSGKPDFLYRIEGNFQGCKFYAKKPHPPQALHVKYRYVGVSPSLAVTRKTRKIAPRGNFPLQ